MATDNYLSYGIQTMAERGPTTRERERERQRQRDRTREGGGCVDK